MADDDVTISAEQAKVLQNAYNLMNKLYSHPDKAMDFKRLVKGAGFAVPELDTIEKVTKPYDEKIASWEDKFNKLQEKIDKRDTDDLNAKEEAQISKDLESARKEYGLTDDGMKKVLDRMKEKKNLDVEAAAAYIVSKEPKAQPTTNSHNYSQSRFKGSSLIGGDKAEAEETWKSLTKNPDDYFDSVVNDVMNNPMDQIELGGKK